MNQQTLTMKKNEIEMNPIGLSRETAEMLVPRMDEQMASLFTLFHQYQKHHWLVMGPQFRDLHLYLEESYNQVHQDLDAVAERITVLGGVPSSNMTALVNASYVEEEPEGVFSVRDMLVRDRDTEKMISSNLRPLIERCREVGDYGSEQLLKNVLLRSEERCHELDHYLENDSLEKSSS